jgi:hypothetical protein
VLGRLELSVPSPASRSKKSDHRSARFSLLPETSAFKDAVLGLRNGDIGTRSAEDVEDAPGRARPVCSFCSVSLLDSFVQAMLLPLTFRPSKQRCYELKNLESLWVRTIQSYEVDEMVGHHLSESHVSRALRIIVNIFLPVNHVFWISLLDEPQGLRQMIIQYHSFVTQFSNKQILFLDFFLKWQRPFQLLRGLF